MDSPTPMEINVTLRQGPLTNKETQLHQANNLCLYLWWSKTYNTLNCPLRPGHVNQIVTTNTFEPNLGSPRFKYIWSIELARWKVKLVSPTKIEPIWLDNHRSFQPFWWPQIHTFVEDYVRTCETCCQRNILHHRPYSLLYHTPIQNDPNLLQICHFLKVLTLF